MALKVGDRVRLVQDWDSCLPRWGPGELVGFDPYGFAMVKHDNGRCGSGPNGEGLWNPGNLVEVLPIGNALNDRQVARKVMRDIAQDPTVPAGTRLDAAVTLIRNA